MANATFRVIKKPNPVKDFALIRQEVETALKPVVEQHVNQRQAVVSDFTNQPKFSGKVAGSPKQLEVQVFLDNPDQQLTSGNGTIRDLVKWLFRTGTKAHKIKPKKPGGLLRFPWGGPGSYSRKTSTGGKSKGTGKVSNAQITYKKEVKHPGSKRSDAFDRINKRLSKFFLRQADRGTKKGLKRIGGR